ncbi:MAG TPA: hypothetical protein VHC18_13365 [Amycolatopsis sp.]|nr:hypothetical protein [Amycolatopsis sp.]
MSTGPFSQPNYPGFPPPHVRPRRARNAGPVVAAVFAVLAAAALVVGSFLPSMKIRSLSNGRLQESLTITSWDRTIDPPPTGSLARYYAVSHVPLYGIPLAAIAAGLLVAAVLVVARRGGAGRAAVTAAATAALAGVFMLAMDVESSLSYEDANPSPGSATHYEIGLGSWIILGGAVLALIAALCTIGRTDNTDRDATPPQGFPAPVPGYRPPAGYYQAPPPMAPPGYPAAPPRTPPRGFPPPQSSAPAWPHEEVRQHGFQGTADEDSAAEDVPRHGVLEPPQDVTSRLNPAEDDSSATESSEHPHTPPPWAPQRHQPPEDRD